jgi:hypothetical protein
VNNLESFGNVDILQLLFSNSLPGSQSLQASSTLLEELGFTDFGMSQASPAINQPETCRSFNQTQVTSSSQASDQPGVPIRNLMDHQEQFINRSEMIDGVQVSRSSESHQTFRTAHPPGLSDVHLPANSTRDRGQEAIKEANSVLSMMVSSFKMFQKIPSCNFALVSCQSAGLHRDSSPISSSFLDLSLRMFFSRFLPTFPVFHSATFDIYNTNAPLLLNMIAVGSLFLPDRGQHSKVGRHRRDRQGTQTTNPLLLLIPFRGNPYGGSFTMPCRNGTN